MYVEGRAEGEWLSAGTNLLVDGDGVPGDVGVVYPVYVGVRAVDEGLRAGAQQLRVRVVVLVPQLGLGALLLVLLLDRRLVVRRWPVRWDDPIKLTQNIFVLINILYL